MMIHTLIRPCPDVPAPAQRDMTGSHPGGGQPTRPTPRTARPTGPGQFGVTGTSRFVVSARLPITIAVWANTATLATGYAATRTATILGRVPAVFLRGRAAPVRLARHADEESVTAVRILHRAPNPGLPRQPVYTIAATVLLGLRVDAPDRTTARQRAQDLLRAGITGLRTSTLRAHIDALDITSVRKLEPTPTRRARRHQPSHWPPQPSSGAGQSEAAA